MCGQPTCVATKLKSLHIAEPGPTRRNKLRAKLNTRVMSNHSTNRNRALRRDLIITSGEPATLSICIYNQLLITAGCQSTLARHDVVPESSPDRPLSWRVTTSRLNIRLRQPLATTGSRVAR
eukprot:1192840-Prorocentrum_minimum.AAC.6